MKRYLLDSSFVIDFLDEVAGRVKGPAMVWLATHPGAELWISPVTFAEVLEGADDEETVRETLNTFRWQTIGHQQAERAALRQSRSTKRIGENDAWQVAVAECMEAVIVGHDPKAFDRPGVAYEDHRGKREA